MDEGTRGLSASQMRLAIESLSTPDVVETPFGRWELFDGVPKSYALELISSNASKNGIVELRYRRPGARSTPIRACPVGNLPPCAPARQGCRQVFPHRPWITSPSISEGPVFFGIDVYECQIAMNLERKKVERR